MNRSLTIVVDADAIVAQVSQNDSNHEKAVFLSNRLQDKNIRLIYPSGAILEATTVLQRQLGSGATALGTATALTQSDIDVVSIDKNILKDALTYFSPTGSKKNTLFDCTVAAIAKKYEADAIFSFDKFYKKIGFKLLSDIE